MERMDLYHSDRSIFKSTHFVKVSANQVKIEFVFDISVCALSVGAGGGGRMRQQTMNELLHVHQNGFETLPAKLSKLL